MLREFHYDILGFGYGKTQKEISRKTFKFKLTDKIGNCSQTGVILEHHWDDKKITFDSVLQVVAFHVSIIRNMANGNKGNKGNCSFSFSKWIRAKESNEIVFKIKNALALMELSHWKQH